MAFSKNKNETTQVWNFRGKYADCMKDLTGGAASYQKIFNEIYEGYAFCALYGLMKGRKHTYDPTIDNPNNSDPSGFRWAYADKGGIYGYDRLRKIILLYGNPTDTPFSEKIDNALRFDYPTNDVSNENLIAKSKYGDNSEIIDEYVLGGLELIHEKVMNISSPQEMISFMRETLNEFKELNDLKIDLKN